jgi:hypothetical protein
MPIFMRAHYQVLVYDASVTLIAAVEKTGDARNYIWGPSVPPVVRQPRPLGWRTFCRQNIRRRSLKGAP